MSYPLLRTSRSLCSSCLRWRRHRLYSSQAALATSIVPTSNLQQTETLSAGPSNGLTKTTPQKRAQAPGEAKTGLLVENETPSQSRNPLEPTRVDLYLASIHAAGLEPTLDDIERCRPKRHSSPESFKYAEEYNNLLDTLCRSFSKDQLRKFTELYNLDPIWTRSSRRKVEYAESIMEKQWNWPSLKEIERRQRDKTEVVVKTFSVNPSQLFLILGKDGADLLQLSMQYNVHISLASNPLALRVEGLRGKMKRLTEHLSELKKGIIDEIVELPSKRPIRQDLVQRISRLAGAYVENLGHKGKIRICAKDTEKMDAAKRLALRASTETQGDNSSPLLCYVPAKAKLEHSVAPSFMPHTYSVYPFLSPRSLPWTMVKGGSFRVRRVADWLGAAAIEDTTKTGGLSGGQGKVVTKTEETTDLEALLLSAPMTHGHERLVSASFGHIILGSVSPTGHSVLSPPLKGNWTLSKILKWLHTSNTPLAFVPSPPATLLNSPPSNQKVIHRVLYRTLPESQLEKSLHQQLIKLELEFSMSDTAVSKAAGLEYGDSDRGLAGDFTSELDINHNPSYSLEYWQGSEGPSTYAEPNPPEVVVDVSEATCLEGVESTLDVMMPDRPMDVQFTVFEHTNVCAGDQPPLLVDYAKQLRHFLTSQDREAIQPQPPATLNFRGRTYFLQTSLSVRKVTETTQLSTGASGNMEQSVSARVITESMLDLESNQKFTTCQVTLDDSAGREAWTRFLASCDLISTVSIPAQGLLPVP
ncbi:hypothetical protein DEU56DRAFT_140884 [Suillus clintonianus]|uniref:uncharacterized protein n=1 Tax=Suillus clintonianus TaxID=1904413 RepID=UPI001B86E84B|nr:uncharacterized protein DEU56DRAFT_140884 [Suillus clintonianus]KAG2118417.1 hypothetical protein DEU56DRAFT_140884 [Suillus clintonianus]